MNRTSFHNRGYAFKGLLAVIHKQTKYLAQEMTYFLKDS